MSKPTEHLRVSLQALLTQLAADAESGRGLQITVRIAGVDGGKIYTLDPERGELSFHAKDGQVRHQPGSSAGLTPMQADILEALRDAGKELSVKKLAAKAGYRLFAHFRYGLRDLLERRLIQRGLSGYRLPE